MKVQELIDQLNAMAPDDELRVITRCQPALGSTVIPCVVGEVERVEKFLDPVDGTAYVNVRCRHHDAPAETAATWLDPVVESAP